MQFRRQRPRRPFIFIHALLAESDSSDLKGNFITNISIHALLAESDITTAPIPAPIAAYFYPRSPCGERRGKCAVSSAMSNDFYPRSPCGERQRPYYPQSRPLLFLSTLSLRRATCWSPPACRCRVDFYPRSPCGERRGLGRQRRDLLRFLSTLSLRRATDLQTLQQCQFVISIHALLAESDLASIFVYLQ